MTNIHQLKARERSKLWYEANKNTPEFEAKRRARTLKWRENNPERYLLQHAKARAKDRNVHFDLVIQDIKVPLECPVLKVPFKYGTEYTMSVDRINPNLGYTKDNIQVISWKANRMKQNASIKELKDFALWVNQSTLS